MNFMNAIMKIMKTSMKTSDAVHKDFNEVCEGCDENHESFDEVCEDI